ncbi:MAG: protein-disulfide reductase DsbD family protein [Rhodospirillales bacterium]
MTGPIAVAALLADGATIVPGRPFEVALRLTLPDGWHTYWRNTGDAGAPTAIDWTLPSGFAADPIAWPVPSRYTTGPVVSYGFGGDVWLLTRITPPADLSAGTTASLTAAADWLVCADICIPEQATLTLQLPVATVARPAAPEVRAGFTTARQKLPEPFPGKATLAADGDRLRLDLTMPATAERSIEAAWFFPDRFGVIDNAGAQTLQPTDDGIRLVLPKAKPAVPGPLSGVLVLQRGGERHGYDVIIDDRS